MKVSLRSVFLVAAISLVAVTGCRADDDDTPNGADAGEATPGIDANAALNITANCASYCDNQGTATDCPEEVATQGVANCKLLCDAVIQSLDEECKVIANAFFTCSVSSDRWQCLEGGNLPVQVDDSCKAESDAYASCLAPR